jgi:hypothetical protein
VSDPEVIAERRRYALFWFAELESEIWCASARNGMGGKGHHMTVGTFSPTQAASRCPAPACARSA